MCAIFGFLKAPVVVSSRIKENLEHIANASFARGRDGYGYSLRNTYGHFSSRSFPKEQGESLPAFVLLNTSLTSLIGNVRAEPTTEYLTTKRGTDQQPYHLGSWTIVHNGTIANDKELRAGRVERVDTQVDSAAIVEVLAEQHLLFHNPAQFYETFRTSVGLLKGSYAIMATNSNDIGSIYVAVNYRPVWYAKNKEGVYFASAEEFFPSHLTPVRLTPYTTNRFYYEGANLVIDSTSLRPRPNKRALVIASGGMDSTVAAVKCVTDGYSVELLHFTYGCKAETKEFSAVKKIAQEIGSPVHVLGIPIYDGLESTLTSKGSSITQGEVGAEYAHEWVPARNLVMLSIATAYAESHGFDYIVLGNNMEEAGAYPDNEPEFVNSFNKVLPYAVADGKSVNVLMPVGNLMKHEIVALGLQLDAPLDLTWSCYHDSELHCGKCAPCYMRKKAFNINQEEEVIQYAP